MTTRRVRPTTEGKYHQGWHRHEDQGPACLCPMGRFWIRVAESEGCWEWLGARDTFGYGLMKDNGRDVRAHRWSYEHLVGPIPDGLVIDHLCRNKSCVRPEHIEPVDNRTNTIRGTSPFAINAAKTHCINGHEFTPENTIHSVESGNPRRSCRACRRATWTAYNRRRRAGSKASQRESS